MKPPTLLVTGHKGLLGSACVRQLGVFYDILTYPDNLVDEVKFRKWFKLNKPDYIIHCAAKVGGVKANQEQPVDFLTLNLAIQNNVICTAGELGVKKLVFIGTSCLYPDNAPVPVKESSLLTGPFNPSVEAYSTAKLAGYALCKAYRAEKGVPMVTVCPSNLYGLNDNYGPSAHVIPALIHRLHAAKMSNGALTVWGNGTAVREFMAADDAARAIGLVLREYDSPELINIGTGQGHRISALVAMLCDAAEYWPQVNWDCSQPTGIQEKTFDVSKLDALGFKPQIDLFHGLQSTYRNYLLTPHPRFK